MNYITLNQLRNIIAEDILISLVNDEGLSITLLDENDPTHTPLISRITTACTTASAMIDSYCGVKYATPFTTLPPILEDVAMQIALYRLYLRRGDEGIPQVRQNAYNDALKKLQDIAASVISLGVTPAPAYADRAAATTTTETYKRTFDKKSLHAL